ncbi:MAG TPA: hypothetical protein VK662_03995, partial [Acidothermaceae bacterium]|nr:hypothetical protein [Acidothermaceae bacterium]
KVRRSGSSHSGSSTGISATLIWTAIGVVCLFVIAAWWQNGARRRRAEETDERYLHGLARLSALDDLASK